MVVFITFASGAVTTRRGWHTATLLHDGTVLIAEGETWLVEGTIGSTHRHIYAMLRIPAEVLSPVKTWHSGDE